MRERKFVSKVIIIPLQFFWKFKFKDIIDFGFVSMYICLFSVDGSGTVHLTGHLQDEGDKIKEVSDEDDTDNFAEEEDSE